MATCDRLFLVSILLVCRVCSEGVLSFILASSPYRTSIPVWSTCRYPCGVDRKNQCGGCRISQISLFRRKRARRISMAAVDEQDTTSARPGSKVNIDIQIHGVMLNWIQDGYDRDFTHEAVSTHRPIGHRNSSNIAIRGTDVEIAGF